MHIVHSAEKNIDKLMNRNKWNMLTELHNSLTFCFCFAGRVQSKVCVTFASTCNSWPIIYFSSLASFMNISPLWQLFKTQKLQQSLGSWLNIYRPVHFVLLPGCLDLGFSHIEPIQKAKPKPAAGVTQLNIDSVIKYKLQIGNNHRKQTSSSQPCSLPFARISHRSNFCDISRHLNVEEDCIVEIDY